MAPKKVVFIFLLLLVSIFVVQFTEVQAQSSKNIGVEVNHISSGIEKVSERITMFFKFNKVDQTQYRQYLAKKRLAELKFVIDNNQTDSIEEVASRYETYVGSLTNYVVDSKIVSEKERLLQMYSDHETILEEFASKFETGSGWWFVIEHDININKISAQRVTDLK